MKEILPENKLHFFLVLISLVSLNTEGDGFSATITVRAGCSWCGAYSDCGRDVLEARCSCLSEDRLEISDSL